MKKSTQLKASLNKISINILGNKKILWFTSNSRETYNDVKEWASQNQKLSFISLIAIIFVTALIVLGSFLGEYGFITPIVTLISISIAYFAYKSGEWKAKLSLSFRKAYSNHSISIKNNDTLKLNNSNLFEIAENNEPFIENKWENDDYYLEIIKLEIRNSGRTELRFGLPEIFLGSVEVNHDPIFITKHNKSFIYDFDELMELKPGEVLFFYYNATSLVRQVANVSRVNSNIQKNLSFTITGNDGRRQQAVIHPSWSINQKQETLFAFTSDHNVSVNEDLKRKINFLSSLLFSRLYSPRIKNNFKTIKTFEDYLTFNNYIIMTCIFLSNNMNIDRKIDFLDIMKILKEDKEMIETFLSLNNENEHGIIQYLAIIMANSINKARNLH